MQHRLGLGRKAALRQALGAVEHVDEMARQFGDILAPVLEAGHGDRHDIEAIIEFLPEAARADFGAQVARGGGDDAQIDTDLVGAPGPCELLFHQHAQDL